MDKLQKNVTECNGDGSDEGEIQLYTHGYVVRKRFETTKPDKSKKPTFPPPPPSDATDPLSYLLNWEACSTFPNTSDETANNQTLNDKNVDNKEIKKNSTITPKPTEKTVDSMANMGFESFNASTTKPKDDFKIVLTGDCLREAIKVNNIDAVKKIIDQQPELSKYQDSQKQNPLHVAAIFSRKEIIEILIRNGADISSVDGQGDSVLSLASPVLSKFMKSLNEELNERN
eukprot:CAMPEP_0204825102 /NCGR_PEP_ID=MMETSP1346-20131115/3053_1 /ASSEMBLY_ACC=CAM_ASM_000771 /TAXON_ID=215587 /ORGANISM="Aplanochytrium stocchinoi, Strain GSBS06" /LENGTH=229 /DNA_ID=CAMNT_0051952603 /DNA_START=316 /DNA_END=1005 /DNA_ORIENTATION=+